MRGLRSLAVALALLPGLPGLLHGQAEGDRFQSRLTLRALEFDNFFLMSEDSSRQRMRAAEVDLRLSTRVNARLSAYLDLEYILYESVDPSSGVTGGLRFDGSSHRFHGYVQGLRKARPRGAASDDGRRDHPASLIANELDEADILGVGGEYSILPIRALQLGSTANFQRLSFDSLAGSTDFYEYGVSLRYRGIGYVLHPEVGASWGERRAARDEDDLGQRALYVRITSIPVDFLYLSARYRMRERDYGIDSPTATNFAREDSHRQWTFSANVKVGEHVGLNAYHALETARSTLLDRDYTSRSSSVGVSFTF